MPRTAQLRRQDKAEQSSHLSSPIAVRDMGRNRRQFLLPFHHPLGQPLEPLRPRLALVALAQVERIREKFSPRNQDRAAEEIVDDVDCELAMEKEDPNCLHVAVR